MKDNSKKICKSINESINLDSFYMFVYGDTWCGKYGFTPFDDTVINTDKVLMECLQIKSNQIKSNQIKSNQIKSNQIKSNQIKSNLI